MRCAKNAATQKGHQEIPMIILLGCVTMRQKYLEIWMPVLISLCKTHKVMLLSNQNSLLEGIDEYRSLSTMARSGSCTKRN